MTEISSKSFKGILRHRKEGGKKNQIGESVEAIIAMTGVRFACHAQPTSKLWVWNYSKVRNRLQLRTLNDFIFDPHFKRH